MNRAPGKQMTHAIIKGTLLWLASAIALTPPLMAQQVPAPPQPYYPGMPPWLHQPQLQPQTQMQAQPAQPVVQPGYQPGLQPQYPAAPAWGAPWQQPAQYYPVPYNWNWPTAPATTTPQQQQPAAPQVPAPYLETRIDSTSAYVHQNLVLSIDVISATSLKTINLEVTDNEDVILRQLGDITVNTRTRDDAQEIVNTIHYLLTPLHSGNIEIEALRIAGIMDGGAEYNAVDRHPIRLKVAAPGAGVQPWLPLHSLEINASLSNDEQVGEGEPITLTIEQKASGMSGTQLPSLEAQLQAPGHRLYLEKTEYNGTITRDGKLLGTRRDRFTLVPQKGNEVSIPPLSVDWWNVDRHRKETAILPGRVLNEGAFREDSDNSQPGWLTGDGPTTLMWLGLLAIAFLLGRYWKRLKPLLAQTGHRLWQSLEISSRPARRRLWALLVRLSPQRNMHIVRRWIADSLPRSARMWFCVRNADNEQDPDDWSQVLRFLVNRRLNLSSNLPMSKLAECIIEIHPWADADSIRALLRELEAALFSGYEIKDFNRWKKEFKQQVRPHLFRWQQRCQHKSTTTTLPELNPGIS